MQKQIRYRWKVATVRTIPEEVKHDPTSEQVVIDNLKRDLLREAIRSNKFYSQYSITRDYCNTDFINNRYTIILQAFCFKVPRIIKQLKTKHND